MTFHWVRARTFVHATESKEKVEKAFRFICGEDAEIKNSKITGFYGNTIVILETSIKDKKEIDKMFLNIFNAANMKKDMQIDEDFSVTDFLSDSDIDNRVDEDSVFFLRLDKQAAFQKMIHPVSHDDIIAVQAKLESYPANREKAIELLKEYIRDLQSHHKSK